MYKEAIDELEHSKKEIEKELLEDRDDVFYPITKTMVEDLESRLGSIKKAITLLNKHQKIEDKNSLDLLICSRCGYKNDNDCSICIDCTEEIQKLP